MEIVSQSSGPMGNGSAGGSQISEPSQSVSQESGQETTEHETSPDVSTPEAAQQQNGQQREHKRESRYERVKRQRAALQERENALKQREERLAQAEAEKSAPKKPEYTAAELKQYRKAWEDEGRIDLVEQADKEIARLEKLEQQEQSQTSFVTEWHTAEAELAQADPEFGAGKGTRLDKQISQIMQGPDGNVYRQHPRGIIAAYHRAKMEILESDHKVALGKIQQLESELRRLNGLTAINGGAPGRVNNGQPRDFSRMSTAEMGKYLRSQAGKGDTPWL